MAATGTRRLLNATAITALAMSCTLATASGYTSPIAPANATAPLSLPAAQCPGEPAPATVTNREELLHAVDDPCVDEIVVRGEISDVPSFRLSAGKRLVGADGNAQVAFASGVDGVQLSSDNSVRSLRLETTPSRRAIFNDTQVIGLGTLTLTSVTTVGSVQLLVQDTVVGGNVVVDGLDIVAADTRAQQPAPQLITPSALLTARPGAFTLWNRQLTNAVTVTADLRGISVGRPDAPVSGSGVFVSGGWNYIGPNEYADAFAGQDAGDLVRAINTDAVLGKLQISRLETGGIYTDSGIPEEQKGSLGNIALLVYFNAPVDQLVTRGPIVCTGVNAGGIDLFSDVTSTTVEKPITTHGQTGIAVVTWANEKDIRVLAPIETFGPGGRGFNVYAGNIGTAEFDQITTHGDGAIGLELRRRVGKIHVHHGIQTTGGTGLNLVIGQLTPLPANAIHVDQGSSVDEITIDGPITTTADGVHAITVGEDSRIGTLYANDGVQATGKDAAEYDVHGGTIQVRTP